MPSSPGSPLVALAAAAIALTAPATAQVSPGARALGLGGTGVASAEPRSAVFANPALTRFRDESEGAAALLPYTAAMAADTGELLDRVEEFQDTLDALQALLDANDPNALALRPLVVDGLAGLDGRTVLGGVDVGATVLLPGRDVTFALGVRERVDARAFPRIAASDLALIQDPTTTSADLEDLDSVAVVHAAEITELSASIAWEGALGGRRFSLGLAPKFATVDVTSYAPRVSDFEDQDIVGDLRDGGLQRRRSVFNADAGLAVEVGDGATLGLAVRDVLRRDLRSGNEGPDAFTYRIRPRPTAGVALVEDGLMFTAEADLWPSRPFSSGGESQHVRMGLEVDALGFARVRAGFAHDLRDTAADLVTFGLGSGSVTSGGGAVAWDLSAAFGDDAIAAAIGLSFGF